uniref:Uncharacterized protein LOC105631075 isoform X2 n=2 Tax=Rhizophora mucronata TaxID=61149 RepID=A0A2P2KCW4_RHIMU
MSDSSLPKFVYSRSKLQINSIVNSSVQDCASTTKSEGACPSIVISDAPSVGVPEQCKASEDTASIKRAGWDYLSFVDSNAPFAVGEQHVVSKFVYGRRKLQRHPIVTSLGQATASTKRIGRDCLFVVSSDAPGAVGEQWRVSETVDDTKGVGDALMPLLVCHGGADALKSDLIDGCSFSDGLPPNEASEKCRQSINEVDCTNESCSSSRSDIESVTATMKTELLSGECSSSRALIVEANLLGMDHCISKLKGPGVRGLVCPSRSHASAKVFSNNNASSNSQLCKICGHMETTLKMLVCDNCEEAFHVSCCNPRIKKIPTDDWFCSSCLKHKHTILKETISRKSSNIIDEKGRSGNASAKGQSNPIELMLRDAEPYTTGVQIGKGFQAEVSEWTGPINDDLNAAGEPLEVDTRDIDVHEMKSNEPSKLGSICNWLQCREVDVGNGTICGKWRRAPLFEVQTDDWECFYSVFWDPSHADCAAAQELETDQVMKQLKCIQMLKRRLAARGCNLDRNEKAVLLSTSKNVRKTRKSILSRDR